MSAIALLVEQWRGNPLQPVLAWRGREVTAAEMADAVEDARQLLAPLTGARVVLEGDFSPRAVAALLALVDHRAIVIPLLPATLARAPSLPELVGPQAWITIDRNSDAVQLRHMTAPPPHDLLARVAHAGAPGLVLFTSGSTGQPKAVVHDFGKLLRKFTVPRPAMRTLNFLLFDHWGGLNTLLHCLFNGSLCVLPEDRSPDYVCALIERHRVELLPASPTFLGLLLLSRAHERYDLGSLRVISYGSEPMLPVTLDGLRKCFPSVELRQTYGLIELGVMRAKSRANDSLWVRIGGEGYDWRVVDGILQIRAESAMLGYLNAPSPFTEDGYFITGDRVEVEGDELRILGRQSELINVGGQKVYPAEIEDVLLRCPAVADAVVYGERNMLTGMIVCTDIRLRDESGDHAETRRTIKLFCARHLEPFKVPVKITFVDAAVYSDRMKRMRLRSKV